MATMKENITIELGDTIQIMMNLPTYIDEDSKVIQGESVVIATVKAEAIYGVDNPRVTVIQGQHRGITGTVRIVRRVGA